MSTGEGREPNGSLPSPRSSRLSNALRGGAFRFIVVALIDALLISAVPALIASLVLTALNLVVGLVLGL